MFKINWTERSLNELDKLEQIISRRIVKNVDELLQDIHSKDVKKLKDDVYRLRVGDYRIIFEIKEDTINILKIGHRKNIYKWFKQKDI